MGSVRGGRRTSFLSPRCAPLVRLSQILRTFSSCISEAGGENSLIFGLALSTNIFHGACIIYFVRRIAKFLLLLLATVIFEAFRQLHIHTSHIKSRNFELKYFENERCPYFSNFTVDLIMLFLIHIQVCKIREE